jgi:aminodeoxychorismate lyase
LKFVIKLSNPDKILNNSEKHIIVDGEIISDSLPVVFHNNRSFCYGDGLFETMHVFGTEIQFLDSHFNRLYNGMTALKLEISENITKEKVKREIVRLLNRDKLFGGVRIKLTVYRNSEGYYTPKVNKTGYIVEFTELGNDYYELNQKGLCIDIFNEILKTTGPLASFKTCNSLLNVLCGIYSKEHGFDDCLILNNKGSIIESSNSNIFLVKRDTIYTPSLEQGCVDGIMRARVMEVAKILRLQVKEIVIANENTLLESDEIFLTNAIYGLRWVMAFRQRRYFNKISKLISDKLNAETFKGK